MKNIIVGTAGHIDHGKTTLIKALTGRNTDRWEEEQRRGITIDLGFTYFDLKNGDRVGIIDVPGHEKFINNRVAGVVGMDLVLLVVAADEGIMPQTREHMDILGLLGIKKSILVINKCDLVDEEWLELVEEEIQEELEESGTIFVFPMKKDTYLWHRDSEFAVRQKIEETLQKYHSEHPYRYGMKKAEIHNTFLKKIKPNIFDAYIERMTGENVYGRREEYLSLPGYEVPKDAMYLQTEKLIEDTFEKAGYDFVRFSEIDFGKIPRQTAEDVVLMMIDEGKVLRINEEMFTMKHLMDEAKEKIQNHLKEENLITIAQVRDMFSTSRKSAKPILEYMDSIKVTKKTGGESERVAYL